MKKFLYLLLLVLVVGTVSYVTGSLSTGKNGIIAVSNNSIVTKSIEKPFEKPTLIVNYNDINQYNKIFDTDLPVIGGTTPMCMIKFVGSYKNTTKSFKFIERQECSSIDFTRDFLNDWQFEYASRTNYLRITHWLDY